MRMPSHRPATLDCLRSCPVQGVLDCVLAVPTGKSIVFAASGFEVELFREGGKQAHLPFGLAG